MSRLLGVVDEVSLAGLILGVPFENVKLEPQGSQFGGMMRLGSAKLEPYLRV